MQSNLEGGTVINNEQAHRFEAIVGGNLALITYRLFPGRIVLDHTEVPALLEGKGLAAKLTRAALDFARAHHLRVVSLCPFISSYVRRHPEVQDLVSQADPQRLLSRSAGLSSN